MPIHPQRLTVFAQIVQAGSISKAAQQLGVGKSVVSRQLAKLEAELGARLVQRSTRQLQLTEVGEGVLIQAQHIRQALQQVEELSGQHQQEVSGRLRVTCPRPLGQRWLVPQIVAFTQMHPKVQVQLLVEDRLVDLIAEQIDVAIRVAHLEDSSLVARPLLQSPRVVVASPAYLARAGTPQAPADLADHECLLYLQGGRPYDVWTFLLPDGRPHPVRVQGRLHANDGMALVGAAVAGAGLLLVQQRMVRHELASGQLVTVLDAHPQPLGQPVSLVVPARPGMARKTVAFMAHLEANLFSA